MQNSLDTSFLLAQVNPLRMSLLGWLVTGLSSFSGLLVFVSGLLIFGGACYLVATRQRTAALAAYLVLLPLPLVITCCGQIFGAMRSMQAIASVPGLSVPTEDLAAATAVSLASVLFAMLISAPTYFVIAYGLLTRTLSSSKHGAAATVVAETPKPHPASGEMVPAEAESTKPIRNSGGTVPATA